jgi:hypothetical protein
MLGALRARGARTAALAAASVACAAGCAIVAGLSGYSLEPGPSDGGPTGEAATRDAPIPDGTRDAAPCGDLLVDPANCGACDHGCLGGACAGGACQPVQLYPTRGGSVFAGAHGVAVDSTSVYWAAHDGNAVLKVSLDGGGFLLYDSTPMSGPWGVAVNGATLFWTTEYAGTLSACPLSGCAGSPTVLAGFAGETPEGMTIDTRQVYWVINNANSYDFTGSIDYLAVTSGPAGLTPPTYAGSLSYPTAVAVDAQNVYWTDTQGVHGAALSGAGAPALILSRASDTYQAVAAREGIVYAATAGGHIDSVPTDGGPMTQIASSSTTTWSAMAVDGTGVYWTHYDTGEIWTAPLDGGVARSIASGQENPWGIALDDASVYWTDDSDAGGVFRLAKP